VPDYQLSLAIGKEGQNARLAARLTGWRIDIKSETQFSEEQAAARAPTSPGEASAPPSATRGDAAQAQGEEFRQCKAILGSGERCSNAARPGSDFCGIPAHQKQGQVAATAGETEG
jgi:N utilization substance protein A